MDRDELLAFLRENLNVAVDVRQYSEFGEGEGLSVAVSLRLGDEEISSETSSVSLPTSD